VDQRRHGGGHGAGIVRAGEDHVAADQGAAGLSVLALLHPFGMDGGEGIPVMSLHIGLFWNQV